MPTIEENAARWNSDLYWAAGGEEWSGPWGGSEAQWWGSLLPRLHPFLPAGTVLEIGPGRGRWTQYLKEICDQLILVDVAEGCIETCKRRFANADNIRYHICDGRSLPDIGDRSIDLAFSFDSLVHAEADVLDAYAFELARSLKADGVGFIHHSNMGSLRWQAALARRLPDRIRRRMTIRGAVVNVYTWRAETATAERFARSCERAGLACVGQEKIAWEYGRFLTDVISTFTPRGSRWDRPNVMINNPRFMEEAQLVAQWAQLYSTGGFGAARSGTSPQQVGQGVLPRSTTERTGA